MRCKVLQWCLAKGRNVNTRHSVEPYGTAVSEYILLTTRTTEGHRQKIHSYTCFFLGTGKHALMIRVDVRMDSTIKTC